MILLATLGLLFLAQPALADGRAHTVVGQEYTLPTGERLGGDLVMLGGVARLQPSSVVDGNVTVVGGQAVIEGNVRGDVVAVGGTAELTAGAGSRAIWSALARCGATRRPPCAATLSPSGLMQHVGSMLLRACSTGASRRPLVGPSPPSPPG